ncbi:hypothetical protein LguiA_002964 [Lonicera macranthoides]
MKDFGISPLRAQSEKLRLSRDIIFPKASGIEPPKGLKDMSTSTRLLLKLNNQL